MKKIVLLFILLVSALNGMEKSISYYLLPELRSIIIAQALESSKNVDETINAIKALSIAHGISPDALFSDIKVFTKVVHYLADKFKSSTEDIAKKFGTPVADKYLELGKDLSYKIGYSIDEVKQLIKDGADINFTAHGYITPLHVAIYQAYPPGVELLIQLGAKPDWQDWININWLKNEHPDNQDVLTVEKLMQATQEQEK